MPDDPDLLAVAMRLRALADESGPAASVELAGALPSDDLVSAISRLQSAANNGKAVRARWHRPSIALHAERATLPWQRGLAAARALREA